MRMIYHIHDKIKIKPVCPATHTQQPDSMQIKV